MTRAALSVLALSLLVSCSTSTSGSGDHVRSLLGDRTYTSVPLSESRRAEHEANLATAQAAYDADPTDEDNIIWLGRRLAYLGRFREAIDVYSRGLKLMPESVKLLRHRGHRYITTRQLDRAAADLERAASIITAQKLPDEIEADGLPNARNQPRSTLHDNVYYHLALTRYLQGRWGEAARWWRTDLSRAEMNDDMLVAYTYWIYLAESRAGRTDAAAEMLTAFPSMGSLDIIENHAYERLLRVFRGELTDASLGTGGDGGIEGVDDATTLYGLGAWALVRGQEARAAEIWSRCLSTDQWMGFGFIAAEADMARIDADALEKARRQEGPILREQLREIQQDRQRR